MSRILAISDIHSKYNALQKLLAGANYDPASDELVLLGDYIDRGEDPVKTLELVMSLKKGGATVLMGNHEAMYLEAIEDIDAGKDSIDNFYGDPNGCYGTLKEFHNNGLEKAAVEFFSGLPMKHRIGNKIFVHAGYNPDVDYAVQSQFNLLWTREPFLRAKIPDSCLIIFGHTPTQWNNFYIWHGANKIGIDCGAAYGGRLACLELRDDGEGTEYYVECT
jgi:serine/threonine protein phosphatase 1